MLIIKKIVSLLLCVLLMGSVCSAEGESAPAVSAHSAVLLHDGGEVLFEKNADEKRLIASTTKLMTALVVIESCDLDELAEVTPECCGIEGSSMYLVPGQRLTVEKLLLGLLLVSGNDAAHALALHTAGSVEGFAVRMNEKARLLGMQNSHFVNPHGLNAEGHYSTARDMGKLMAYAMQNDTFARLIAKKSFSMGEAVYLNHNKLLYSLDGCIGGKTGYTVAAGRCLVSCVERKGTRFICVTLSAPDDWNDHEALYEWAFSRWSNRDLSAAASFLIPVAGGTAESVRAVPEKKLTVFVPNEEELTLTAELPRFLLAPVKAGERVGKVTVYQGGESVKECPLVAERDVDEENKK